jgi:sarcosine oxidase/sarcosine oxidase/L-pipecolate oxidase
MSVPRSHASHPTDTIPTEGLEDIKRLIKKCIPQFEGRELIRQGMCWCTDTQDANWLLCEHPAWKGLVLATGDSGHTFKMLPIVGNYVSDLIEGKVSTPSPLTPSPRSVAEAVTTSQLSHDLKHLWRWRPGAGDPNGTGRGGLRPKDLSEVTGWRHDQT